MRGEKKPEEEVMEGKKRFGAVNEAAGVEVRGGEEMGEGSGRRW